MMNFLKENYILFLVILMKVSMNFVVSNRKLIWNMFDTDEDENF